MTQAKLREIAAALFACECNLGGYRVELMSDAYQLLLDLLERRRGELTPAERYKLLRMCAIAVGVSAMLGDHVRESRYSSYASLLRAELTPAEIDVLDPQLQAHLGACVSKIEAAEQCYSKAHKEGL